MNSSTAEAQRSTLVDFLWLELTNRCNLQCTHCYAESGPHATALDLLSGDDFLTIIHEAFSLGCRKLQFIGGEPTLNHDLPLFIEEAGEAGFTFIEVFSNLVHLGDHLLDTLVNHQVSVATSFYSAEAERHDLVTMRAGSHARTTANIRRILARSIPLRVGVIDVDGDGQQIASATTYLRSLGVHNIGSDRLRAFGRASTSQYQAMSELCGQCAGNTLAVGPDGVVAPCIMSKRWAVGSVLESPLTDLVHSSRLSEVRASIASATIARADCFPQCAPQNPLCGPNCSPNSQCLPCAPNGGHKCEPSQWCQPGK